MANWDPQLVTPTLASAPTALSGIGASSSYPAAQPHHGVIGLVLLAVVVVWSLDKLGFRFAVTAGRR